MIMEFYRSELTWFDLLHLHRYIFRANLEPRIKLFEKCLKQWQHRKLTLMGKITVIKIYALPKIVYVLSSLPDPTKTVLSKSKR